MRDMFSNLGSVLALEPAVQAATVNGATIDLMGSRGVAFILTTGANVGTAVVGAKIQESDNGSTWADAPATAVQTNAPATLLASSTYRLGYLGWKRYVRLVLTKGSGTSLAAGAVAVLHKLEAPVA